jgi:hypothetical protein
MLLVVAGCGRSLCGGSSPPAGRCRDPAGVATVLTATDALHRLVAAVAYYSTFNPGAVADTVQQWGGDIS